MYNPDYCSVVLIRWRGQTDHEYVSWPDPRGHLVRGNITPIKSDLLTLTTRYRILTGDQSGVPHHIYTSPP